MELGRCWRVDCVQMRGGEWHGDGVRVFCGLGCILGKCVG